MKCKVRNCKRKSLKKKMCSIHYEQYYADTHRNVTHDFNGMYLAHYLNKDTISHKEFLRFRYIREKKEKKIIKLQHEVSIVERVMLKCNSFPHGDSRRI